MEGDEQGGGYRMEGDEQGGGYLIEGDEQGGGYLMATGSSVVSTSASYNMPHCTESVVCH